jgi:hypothetical protein
MVVPAGIKLSPVVASTQCKVTLRCGELRGTACVSGPLKFSRSITISAETIGLLESLALTLKVIESGNVIEVDCDVMVIELSEESASARWEVVAGEEERRKRATRQQAKTITRRQERKDINWLLPNASLEADVLERHRSYCT